MKYAIVIPDGAADEPQDSLGGQTPLQAARVPAMDAVAAAGVLGRATFVPASMPSGSDVANLALFGYDPLAYFTGRAPLEAAAQGIALGPGDWAVRCNLVTIENQIMCDFTAGHISTAEAAALLQSAQEKLGSQRLQFVPGVGYRNLLICRGAGDPLPFSADTRSTPPHDLIDKTVLDDYPRGPGGDLLNQLMGDSMAVFAEHPVNVARRAAGKLPATNVWLWGLGCTPRLPAFNDVYHKQGAIITAVDLLRGLAQLIGWRRIDVPGATGYTDTDYAAKGRYAIQALADVDLICVHVEATDEASHEGNAAAKVEAIQQIDRHIVGPLFDALRKAGDYRILVTPDHPTMLRTKSHSHGFVPFAIAGSDIKPDAATSYDDPTAAASQLVFEEGHRLMQYFLNP